MSKLLGRAGAVLLAMVAAGAQRQAAAAEKLNFNSALDSIQVEDLRRHVDVLADDTFEGREAGSRGGRAAAGYLTGELNKLELAGGGTAGDFFQSFGANYRNILAVLPGGDPELSKQYVVVSAHYDHVGYGNPQNSYGPTGYIHNGADDNASGVGALLELAEALARLEKRPSRSILFALWDGEEMGLLGSKHWLANPTLPLANISIMLNMDMVGRLRKDRLEVFGARTSRGLRRLVCEKNTDAQLLLDFTWEMKDDSDHYSFFSYNIPTLMLHTGLHDDYHRPSDDVEKLELDGIRRVTRLMCALTDELANQPDPGGFRQASRREGKRAQQQAERALPALPSRLGVAWDDRHTANEGIRLTRVGADSPAARAGLKVGDIITQFDEQVLTGATDFTSLVLGAQSPVVITVRRQNASETDEVQVDLLGEPIKVGITWRLDDAEPGTAMVTRVVAGSRAARAGVAIRDRILAVNDQPFETSDDLLNLLTSGDDSCHLLLERRGLLRTVALGPLVPPERAESATDAPRDPGP